METQGTRAAIYCRVSTRAQAEEDKTSLADQEAACRQYAEREGLTVVRTYRHAESAAILDKRGKFMTVLADARAGNFDVLLIDRPNRFSRSEDLTEPVHIEALLKDAGVHTRYANGSRSAPSSKPVDQLVTLIHYFGSANEQYERRKSSLRGKRGRVRQGHPLPGNRAPYGYVWKPAADGQPTKTQLDFDPGLAGDVCRRIWRYFLEEPAPSLRALALQLTRELVPTPLALAGLTYRGKTPTEWSKGALRQIIYNGVYWGQPVALRLSKYTATKPMEELEAQPPVKIAAYGPPYVTPEEADSVHKKIKDNNKHWGRPPKEPPTTLLHAGIARCAYCGGPLDPFMRGRNKQTRYYRCRNQALRGVNVPGGCKGVTINAELLDDAVEWALYEVLNSPGNDGDISYLDTLFAAWETGDDTASDQLRVAESTLKELQSQLANLLSHMAHTPATSYVGARLQADIDRLNETLPQQETRVATLREAQERVKQNSALRDQMREYLRAWAGGFLMLARAKQREFLIGVHARVTVWRPTDRTPRAEFVVGLPSESEALKHLPEPPLTIPLPDMDAVHELMPLVKASLTDSLDELDNLDGGDARCDTGDTPGELLVGPDGTEPKAETTR